MKIGDEVLIIAEPTNAEWMNTQFIGKVGIIENISPEEPYYSDGNVRIRFGSGFIVFFRETALIKVTPKTKQFVLKLI